MPNELHPGGRCVKNVSRHVPQTHHIWSLYTPWGYIGPLTHAALALRDQAAMDQHTHPSLENHADEAHTHRGDLSDPHDIDHQETVEAEHATMGHGGHGGHGGHDKHAGHSVAMFRDRFWLSLVLSIPIVLYSHMVQEWLGFTMPMFPGSNLIAPVLGTIVFIYGGAVFLKGGWDELRLRTPGMMLLISLAISVAFLASLATFFGLFDLDFWWELAPAGDHHALWSLAGDARHRPGAGRTAAPWQRCCRTMPSASRLAASRPWPSRPARWRYRAGAARRTGARRRHDRRRRRRRLMNR